MVKGGVLAGHWNCLSPGREFKIVSGWSGKEFITNSNFDSNDFFVRFGEGSNLRNIQGKTTRDIRSSEPTSPGRRSFLDYLLGGTALATLSAIVYPIFRFISPPQVIESTENSVVAAKLSEVPINAGKIFKFGNKPGILVRTASGEFKAFSAVCTHLECIVQYRAETKQIWCACHNGQYNLSGKNIGGPPPRPLEEFKVNTRGDDVVVSRG